jgi:hypothetical protein
VLSSLPPKEPDPADVERLRQSVYAEKRKWPAEALASYVIHRGQTRKKVIVSRSETALWEAALLFDLMAANRKSGKLSLQSPRRV